MPAGVLAVVDEQLVAPYLWRILTGVCEGGPPGHVWTIAAQEICSNKPNTGETSKTFSEYEDKQISSKLHVVSPTMDTNDRTHEVSCDDCALYLMDGRKRWPGQLWAQFSHVHGSRDDLLLEEKSPKCRS